MNELLKKVIDEDNAQAAIAEVPAPEQFGPPAPNPVQQRFQGYLEDQEEETNQSTAIALDAARVQNPKLFRQAMDFAEIDNLPPEVVYRNIDQFDQKHKLDNAREILRTNPTLNDWFMQADNAKTVEVENLENASAVAWTLKAGSRAVSQSADQVEVFDIRYRQMFNLASKEEVYRADRLEATFTDDFGGSSWIGKGYTGALSQLPIMGQMLVGGVKGAAYGGAAGAAIGSVVPGIGTAAGFTSGVGVGGTIGVFRESMKMNSAEAYSEYRKFRTDDGRKLDEDTARGAALISGSIAAGLDTASLGVLFKATGLGSLLTKYGVKTGIKEALKDATFRQVALSVGKRFAGAIGAETVTESIQEGVKIAFGEAAKGWSEHGIEMFNQPSGKMTGGFKPVSVQDAAIRMAEAGRDAFLATAFLGVIPMGGRMAMDMAAARQHVDSTPRIEGLIELAKKDPLVKEDPARAAEIIGETLKGSDKDTVYIDTAAIKEYLQEEDHPAAAALASIPGFQQRLTEAVQTGGDVAIDTADFYAYVAASDAAADIVKRLKFSPEGMSKVEAEKFVKALEKVREKGLEVAEPKGSVATDIYERTRKTGATPDQARQYAALYSAFFDSMAAATGRSAHDIYSAYNLEIVNQPEQNPDLEQAASFNQDGEIIVPPEDAAAAPAEGGAPQARPAPSPNAPSAVAAVPEIDRVPLGQGHKALRGSISFAPHKTTIRMFRQSNLSTFLHESGHLFLQVMADLVDGKRALGGQLFQDNEIALGDSVLLYDDNGNQVGDGPLVVTSVVMGANGPEFRIEGAKNQIFPAKNVVLVSKVQKGQVLNTVTEAIRRQSEKDGSAAALDAWLAEHEKLLANRKSALKAILPEVEAKALEKQESEQPEVDAALPVGESSATDPAALEVASAPENLSAEDSQYYDGKFDLLKATNANFERFVEGKPAESSLDKRDLIFSFFPKSKEAQAYRQSKAHRAQNAAAPKAGPGIKANPLGVQTENVAILNIDETVSHASSVIAATAKLNRQLSGRYSEKVFKALRMSLKKMRTGANAEAWAELETELQAIQQGGTFPDRVKEIVNEYIRLYKKDEALRTAKEENKAERERQKAAGEVEAARKEDLAAALTELSTVVERLEKVEQQREVSEQLKADMATLQEWLGESGPVFSTAAHEKFARGFEAYLMEGNAPNPALVRAFDRFKTWLKLVYRKITNLGVRPTDEVRAVFDRMLTADQSINNEVQGGAFKPAFSSAEEMGVTPEEFQAYLDMVNSLADVGRKAAERAITTEAQKLRTAAIKAKKKELRAQIKSELSGQRVYRVSSWLKGKKIPGIDNVKLDRARVEQILGAGKLGSIPNGSKMWTDEGGVDPNVAATMFGYASGAEMLADIQSNPPLKIAIDQRVEEAISQVTDEELITSPEVAEMAAAKLRGEVYREFVKTEIRSFSKLMGIDFSDAHVAQFKRMADDIINDKTVRTVARRNFVKEYTEADRKIGVLLDKAIKKKDYSSILDLRRKQLLNSYLIQNAYQAKRDHDAAVKYLRGFTKAKAGVIEADYLAQIRNISISLGFMKGKIDTTAPALGRFLDEELNTGNPILIDPRIKKPVNKPYLRLTHGELMGIRDSVKNLDFVGRNKRKLFKEGKVLDLRSAVEEIAQAMDRNVLEPKESPTLNRRGFNWVMDRVSGYFANHIKIEQLCDWIDGRAPSGPAHKYIFQPMAKAQADEVELTQQYAQKVLEIIRQKDHHYWSDEIVVPEVGKRVRRSEMLAVALNMGNESNLKKLKKGMGWSDAQLQAITGRLDATDWQIAQQIWDTIDGLWPHVLHVAARTGLPRPDRVEPVSFTNEHGIFRGGYYPVVYDPAKSADVLGRGLSTAAEAQFGFQPHSIFPAKTFANDRDNEYARPILLDMDVLPRHIAQVVHYVTHAEPAYNVQKIMSHPEFKDRLLSRFGEGMVGNLVGWINNITQGEIEPAGLSSTNRFLRGLRRNVSLAGLGFRMTTVIAQAGGVFSGAEMIGLTGVARGFKEMYGTYDLGRVQSNFDFVRSKSAEMRNRTQFLDRDLTNISAAFERTTAVQRIRDVAMKPMMVADNIVATAVWMGAYTAQIKRDVHDEATAIAYADKVVRLTQGSAGPKDLAAIQRGNEFMKLFTMFYTYFSAMQNRLHDTARSGYYRATGGPELQNVDTPNELLRFTYLIILPSVIFDFMMKGAMQGDFDEDSEKDKSLLGTALWKVFGYTFAGMVGIREFSNFVGKDGFEWKYNGPPLLENIARMIARAGKLGEAAVDPDKDMRPGDALRTAVDVIGISSGVPVDAPTLILQNYLKAQEKGENIGPADFFVRR